MRQKYVLAFLTAFTIVVNLVGIIMEIFWLEEAGRILFVLPLLGLIHKQLSKVNPSFYIFLLLVVLSSILEVFRGGWILNYIGLGLWMAIYIFLIREAIRFTEYEKGSRFMVLYFILVVAINAYLLSLHVIELERSLGDGYLLSYYIIYYLNILILAIAALVYYLNSFSRKSVFFMCLTISFIFADVLRDMEVIYFPDLSVEIVGSLIRFAGISLTLLFFVTPEKKLRLLHLI